MPQSKVESDFTDDDLIETAKKRFSEAEEFEKHSRKDALDDWKFRAGEQWPDGIRSQRELEGRPTLVINRILQPIRQVTNDQRQNRPAIKVHPVDDYADIETAKILQGMVRHIEQDSNADVAYDTAFEGAVVGGIGWYRVYTEYVDPMSFDQEIKIGMVDDWASVYLDPSSKEPDGSDAQWGLITVDIPKLDFVANYGESKLSGVEDWTAYSESQSDWVKTDSCRVAEYFYKEYKNVKVAQLIDGSVVEWSKLEEAYPDGVPEDLYEKTKTARVPVIYWCKLNGIEVLDKTEWLGKWIPLIPVYGDRYVIEGKRYLEGIVRHAKDPARMYNYWKSTETETISLAPKAPWLVAEGQIPRQYEQQWRTANRKSHAYLTYAPTTHEGQLVGPPQRNTATADVSSITQAGMFAADDLKATTGIYDASMGNQSNETSGIAIQRRNVQAQTSNFHLVDNLTRSIRHTGRILVDLIPKIYDTARAARIIGEEGEEEIIKINQEFERKGEKVTYSLNRGKFDVSIATGPSYATKRQEAAANMLELARSAPILMNVAPDLIIKTLDMPGAQEIAERMKKTVDPKLIDDKSKTQMPPEAQAQMAQMSQMIEQMTANLNEANETIKTKRIEIESKEKIEAMKLETQILLKKMEQAKEFADAQVERQLMQLQALQDAEAQDQMAEQTMAPEAPPTAAAPDLAMEQVNQPAGGFTPSAEEQL